MSPAAPRSGAGSLSGQGLRAATIRQQEGECERAQPAGDNGWKQRFGNGNEGRHGRRFLLGSSGDTASPRRWKGSAQRGANHCPRGQVGLSLPADFSRRGDAGRSSAGEFGDGSSPPSSLPGARPVLMTRLVSLYRCGQLRICVTRIPSSGWKQASAPARAQPAQRRSSAVAAAGGVLFGHGMAGAGSSSAGIQSPVMSSPEVPDPAAVDRSVDLSRGACGSSLAWHRSGGHRRSVPTVMSSRTALLLIAFGIAVALPVAPGCAASRDDGRAVRHPSGRIG